MPTRPPTTEQILRKLCHQFMAATHEAFAAAQYDVAYHALMAALHCAQELKDGHALADVAQIAAAQLTEIDAQHPEYQHSTRSAAARRHESIFLTLRRQAGARRHMLEVEAQQPTSRAAPPDAAPAAESAKK